MAMFRCGVNSNATEPTLLWTNPNPSSVFNPQTIYLDLSEYTEIIIEGKLDNTNYQVATNTILKKGVVGSIGYGNETNIVSARNVTFNDTEIVFKHCASGNNNEVAKITNGNCIPLRIYGVKNDAQIGNSNLSNTDLLYTFSTNTSDFMDKKIAVDFTKYRSVVFKVKFSDWPDSQGCEYFSIFKDENGNFVFNEYNYVLYRVNVAYYGYIQIKSVDNTGITFGRSVYSNNGISTITRIEKIWGIK